MALNFSHRPIFSSHISEDSLVSPMRVTNRCFVDGIPERGGDCFDYEKRERGERNGSPESSKDVIDLLPSDPFGMDISSTVTAITGWLEDLEVDCRGYGVNYNGNNLGEYNLFAGLNLFLERAVRFQAFPSNFHFGENSDFATAAMHTFLVPQIQEPKDIFSNFPSNFYFGESSHAYVVPQIQEPKEVTKIASFGSDDGSPHQALAFSLIFLGIRDLLSVDSVCKSLHLTVQSDPLLWRSIQIDQPLNDKICDDILLKLSNRAQGSLQSLSLVECPRITDDGLRDVLETNPRLTKLCVPGCTRLSIEGVVNNLKAFNSKNTPGISHLRIGGLYGITDEHFEELKLLLGVELNIRQNDKKPLFYHKGNLYISCDDDRAIDIETCPKCQKLRLVYDCPSEGCQKKRENLQACRACRLCIPRCVQCGCCINDSEYEETFCLDWLCSHCSKNLVKCSDQHDGNYDVALENGSLFNSVVHG